MTITRDPSLPRLKNIDTFHPIPPELSLLSEYYDSDGVCWQEVDVMDRGAEGGQELRDLIADFNAQLTGNPDLLAPTVDKETNHLTLHNEVSIAIYRDNPGMTAWRSRLVPTALALYPLYRPDDAMRVLGPFIDELDGPSRDLFVHARDSIAIRNRSRAVMDIAGRQIKPNSKITSIASGAAVSMVDTIRYHAEPGFGIEVDLVDRDSRSLDFAEQLFAEAGLIEQGAAEVTTHPESMFRYLTNQNNFEKSDIVEAIGIFEYVDDDAAPGFLAALNRLVKPGGSLIVANMLDTHPDLEFNQRGVGWPMIYPRSKEMLIEIIEKASLPLDQVSITLPSDGVNAIIEIKK